MIGFNFILNNTQTHTYMHTYQLKQRKKCNEFEINLGYVRESGRHLGRKDIRGTD